MRCTQLIWLVLFALVGCTPAIPARGLDATPATESAPVRKTITVGALNSVKGFSPWLIGTTGGGARSLFEIHTNGLVTTDDQGNFVGRLAERMPSFDDGTIVALPDGRLRTTWELRPNIKWHDGAPFSADDLVFSWRVHTDPATPSGGTALLSQIQQVEAPDPRTAVITWKTTFFRALQLDFVSLWPFPEHVLGSAFEGDREAFLNLPYWTTEYVGLGPFRVADFGLGENLALERFDEFFLGRPRVDRIVIRIIPDQNALLTNLKAGAIDVAAESTLGAENAAQLRDEWQRNGEGAVVQKPSAWRIVTIQFNPDYGRPPELRQDVRIRRGLVTAVDRAAVRDTDLPGFNTDLGTFMLAEDPRASLVGQPFAGLVYDPTLALQQLAEAGWRRGADSRMLNVAGELARLDLRGTVAADSQITAIAQFWRDLGIDVAEEIMPGSLSSERSYRATFPGLEFTAQGASDTVLVRFDGRQCPRLPRFSGSQGGCYMNPELDRLIDRLYGTIDTREQGLALRDIGQIFASDLPALPMYMNVSLAAVRKGIHALITDYPGGQGPGTASRNAHLWDRE